MTKTLDNRRTENNGNIGPRTYSTECEETESEIERVRYGVQKRMSEVKWRRVMCEKESSVQEDYRLRPLELKCPTEKRQRKQTKMIWMENPIKIPEEKSKII